MEHTMLPDFDAGLEAPVYLTREIEGIGGEIKARPEDFLVQELPLYPPSGEGEHIYLYVEKRMLSTLQLRDSIARHFRVNRNAIGHAGLKDKHAITQQVISVHTPGKTPEDFPSFQHDRARVLWVDMHTNKLGRGHLSGNRFSIKVRGVDPTHVMRAQKALMLLSERGCPNRFGPQRFGYLLNNHLVGRALILGDHQLALDLLLSPHEGSPKGQLDAREAYARGDYGGAAARMHKVFKVECRALRALARGASAEEAMGVVDPTAAGFYISSFQSAIFNQVLNERVIEGTHDTLVEGDVATSLSGKYTFHVDSLTRDEPEVAKGLQEHTIGPSGPMWGTSMERARGEIGEREHQALVRTGLSTKDLESCESRDSFPMIGGSRRPMRIPVISPEVEGGVDEHGAYIRCAFELPKGSFATTVMDEIMKLDPGSPVEASQETSSHE